MTSMTFIRREIEAVEAQLGAPIKRFACRKWGTALVDGDDIAEQARTEYLISGNAARLIGVALIEAIARLPRLIAVLPLWWHVYRQARGGLARHVGYLAQALLFRRRTAALGIDHVHAHFSTNAACVAMLAEALGGASYSFTVHGPDELVAPARNALARKTARAAFVVAITDYCRARILEEAPGCADRVIIVACGIDLAEFAATPADPAEAARLTCVGRLCANKAQVLIPEAVAAVRGDFPDIVVDLIGDGEARGAIEAEIARHGVADHVRLLGWAANDRVRAAIAGSGALLLPTLAEGLPIVLMEALALARPVVTTRVAGIPELVDGGCGWVVEPGSTPALIGALRDFLATPAAARAAMGAEGRRRVEGSHEVHACAAALLAAFRTRHLAKARQ